MRKVLVAGILAAAVVGVGFVGSATLFAQAKPDTTRPDAAKADAPQAQVPVRQVVLYSSGVGYFEHFGMVKGNGTTELRFKTQQINDILKSLVLQDMDKGKVGVITYPSQDPISKTLRSFQIDIANNPGVFELLGQLRGAPVKITLGGETVTGTVLGVEKKPRAVGADKDGKGGQVINSPFVNLITDAGIRSIPLDDVRAFELQDAKLKDELTRALAALASARDQDKKPVNISFTGDGERRLRIGYVVETPVWKTSYRLLLSDKPADGPKVPAPKAGDPKAGEGDALQGWAIVENQTDNDWNDVQLSLVSGRPISFIMDLYQPLYIPRPIVQPELYASLRPQTYDGGITIRKEFDRFADGKQDEQRANRARERESLQELQQQSGRNAAPAKPGTAAGGLGGGGGGGMFAGAAEAIDPGASVSSIASAAKVGELFQYTVGNVSLPRQTSAMIPVVTDPVEVEKLSIYNLTVLPKNPLLGARLKNTTGKHLLQGPITVLDGGSYAGDARVEDLPPGQERLISYGVDQQIIVQAENNASHSTLTTGRIVKGVLFLTFKDVEMQEYVADNKGDKDKTLLIEHARLGSEWKLVEPAKADETTDDLYRFKGKVAAGKATKLVVKQELTRAEQLEVLPMDPGDVLNYSNTGEIPKDVRDALTKAVTLKQAVVETQRKIGEKQAQITQISQEQTRLRDNMKTVAQNTEYYNRLLKKLDEQESQIEALQKEIGVLQVEAAKQNKAVADYLATLNVG
ncbi:hypothetical protein [Humisphaera borealis]|uniref:DUF4139 domain-containing protein n=1 Tax=Humisphaera borealis TaxID=2807512 RepID=A0A7M2WYD1_9BACT|nr:hypothetical protein [Humisphaera borealis]QOV90413.1 hypothetical protein IPV69_03330 [Humisphaera borealis]